MGRHNPERVRSRVHTFGRRESSTPTRPAGDPVGSKERQGSGQVSTDQSRALGDQSIANAGRAPRPSSGMQALPGHWRLSVSQRRGPAPAYVYLVMLAHSLFMAQMRQGRARDWAHTVLTTIGEACRAVSRETLSKTISWVVNQTTIGWTEQRIVAHPKL